MIYNDGGFDFLLNDAVKALKNEDNNVLGKEIKFESRAMVSFYIMNDNSPNIDQQKNLVDFHEYLYLLDIDDFLSAQNNYINKGRVDA